MLHGLEAQVKDNDTWIDVVFVLVTNGAKLRSAFHWHLKGPPSWPQLALEVRSTLLTLQSKLLLLGEL
jgi:hypothetical protein